MDLIINEKQLKHLVSNGFDNQEIKEQDVDPTAAQPTAGTSTTQSGGQGYPEVGKWESGVTRGPANQIGTNKYADVVSATLKRSKSNPLK